MSQSDGRLAVAPSLLAAGTIAFASTAWTPHPVDAQMPAHPFEVGTPFPTVSLPSLEDGRPASIADYRGKKVILHVFASW